jgi:hypothetical protein
MVEKKPIVVRAKNPDSTNGENFRTNEARWINRVRPSSEGHKIERSSRCGI